MEGFVAFYTARAEKAPLVWPLCRTSLMIKDLVLPTPPGTGRRGTGDQLKTWATTIKAGLELLSWSRA